MPGMLWNVIGSLVGDAVATKNKKYKDNLEIDPYTGDYLDAKGNVVSDEEANRPYNKPDFWTKVFHSDVAQQENAFNNAEYNARLQEQTQQGIFADRFNTVKDYLGANIGPNTPPVVAGLQLNGNVSPQNVLGAQRALAGNFWGEGQSGAAIQNLSDQLSKAGLTEDILRGNAVLESQAKQEGFLSDIARGQSFTPLIGQQAMSLKRDLEANDFIRPFETGARALNYQDMAADAERSLANRAAKDTIASSVAQTGIDQAAVAQALAAQNRTRIPALAAIQGATTDNELFNALHPPTPADQFYRVGSSYKPNPAYVSPLAQVMSGTTTGSATTVPVGGGLHLPVGGSTAIAKPLGAKTVENKQGAKPVADKPVTEKAVADTIAKQLTGTNSNIPPGAEEINPEGKATSFEIIGKALVENWIKHYKRNMNLEGMRDKNLVDKALSAAGATIAAPFDWNP